MVTLHGGGWPPLFLSSPGCVSVKHRSGCGAPTTGKQRRGGVLTVPLMWLTTSGTPGASIGMSIGLTCVTPIEVDGILRE
ncbi:Uncharacterised protein [Mycobacteroides abscessus subsp. abscessus]|nr:Uncharacterised protein [Mycobacteroides abscessus subsp. abscessus]